jgi:NAD(P)H-hydrate epimerase
MSCQSLSREEVRAVDRRAIEEFGMSGLVLMENAGRGAAERLIELGINGPVVICAGKGNNGGDGFVIARHLELHGHDVRVLLFAIPADLSGDAAANWKILEAADTPRVVLGPRPALSDIDHLLSHVDWIVDALLGTGTVGAIREPYRTAIAAINRSGRKVLAVDLPSGLDCDTGRPIEWLPDGSPLCVRATSTVTFVARKRGFDDPASRAFTGDVQAVGIGIPKTLLDDVLGTRPVEPSPPLPAE